MSLRDQELINEIIERCAQEADPGYMRMAHDSDFTRGVMEGHTSAALRIRALKGKA